ncbi:RDD family protein [Brachybacterium sp. GCM10030267]|uniref:RDD family protein n=1 Tax=Brachybacterium sp. GCM10030267 TaxID=3273381 RepID=UPI0036203DCE
MVTQPPMNQSGPGASFSQPSGPGSPGSVPAPEEPNSPELGPPLDGCAPATPLKRFLAALIDAAIALVVLVPFLIGVILLLIQDPITLLPQILIGVGAALPAAYAVLMIWLSGAKGISLGKLILGLRITRYSEGGPIGFLRALGRWFLYGIIWPVMALSIFLDPRKVLRGFHDRAVDSVVVDIKAGRNPFTPRPDDFERPGAEHYLGASSVHVDAHENLLAEPGAAWRGNAQAQGTGASAAAHPSSSGAWAAQPQAESPYAPPAPSGSSASEPQVSASPWSSPPPASWENQSAAPQQSEDSGWAPPPPAQQVPAPQQPQPSSWDEPQHPETQAPQLWSPPPAAAAPPAPAAAAPPAPGSAQPPEPQHHPDAAAEPVPAPSELTADAWDPGDGEVDERTRMTAPDEPLEDLEQTRVSVASLPPARKLRLTDDTGTDRVVDRAVVIGRNPTAAGGEVLFVLKDDTRSVSKTHLRADGTGEEITVTDLGSTNGSTILREDGSREHLVPNTPTVLPAGAKVTLGDRTLSVEREQ